MNNVLYEQLIHLKHEAIEIHKKVLKEEEELKNDKAKANSTSKLNQVLIDQKQKVSISINGQLFCTSISTLSKYKTIFTPYLSSFDPSDTIVIYHSPKLFPYVIEFMREGMLDLSVMDSQTKDDVLQEAAFYDFEPLKAFILSYNNTPRVSKLSFASNIVFGTYDIEQLKKPNGIHGLGVYAPLTIKLESLCQVNTIRIGGYKGNIVHWNPNKGEGFPIEISMDQTTWVAVGTIPLGFGLENKTIQFNALPARYIRLGLEGEIGIGYFEVLHQE